MCFFFAHKQADVGTDVPTIALPIETWAESPKWEKRNKKKRSTRTSRCLRFSWSFGTAFLFTILAALIAVGVSVWLFNYALYRHNVNSMAKEARRLLLSRIEFHVNNFVSRGTSIIEVLNSEFQWTDGIGKSNLSTEKLNENLPFILMFSHRTNEEFGGVWFGTEQDVLRGWVLNDTAIPPTKFQLVSSNGEGLLKCYLFNDKLDRAPRAAFELENYYPTRRIWYLRPKTGFRRRWTPVFAVLSDPHFLSVSITMPYYNVTTNEFVGVLTVPFDLRTISNFLKSLQTVKGSRIFIVEKGLGLVAASQGTTSNTTIPSSPSTLSALNSSDLIISETAKKITETWSEEVIFNTTYKELRFRDSMGVTQIATVIGIHDENDLNWAICLVVSEKIIMRAVITSNRVSAIVSGSCIAVALIVALLLSAIISLPLIEIYKELNIISKMKFKATRTYHSFKFNEVEIMIASIEQLKRGLQCFDAFVPSDVVRVLFQNNTSARLGVVRKRITIMFVDITFEQTKELSPTSFVEILQQLSISLSQVASDLGGVVDKYFNECIMFLFNAPSDLLFHELRAVQSSMQMMKKIEELNSHWKSSELPIVSIRVGINTDNCLVGNIGSTTRVSYTALGDAVNVASRLVSLNTRYGTHTIIGPSTKEAIEEIYVCKWLSCLCVKGKSEPLNVYELVAERTRAAEDQKDTEALCEKIKRSIDAEDYQAALTHVREILEKNPEDKAALELEQRLTSSNFCPFLQIRDK